MTEKDYTLIAGALARAIRLETATPTNHNVIGVASAALQVANALASDGQPFDRERFLAIAAGREIS